MDINFELYKVFYHAAKNLNFSKAAENLFISQSAVSQSIKQLEKNLGTKLFFRHSKSMKLTSEGELLFKHIEKAFNFIKSGEKALYAISNMIQGEIRIGASDTICKYFLIPYFKKFHENYPGIKIQITNRPSPVCTELLKKGNIDVAVVNLNKTQDYNNFDIKIVNTIQDVFIAGKKYSDLKGKEISLKELENYPLISLEKNSTTRIYFENLIRENDVKITPEIELGSIDLLVELTKIGLGISFVMETAIKDELDKGSIFALKIKENIPKRSIGIITNSKLPLSPTIKEFIKLFEA